GVSNMLRMYVRDYKAGKLDPKPGWKIVRQSPGTATIDAEKRLGIIVAPKAMRLAMEKARTVGVGIVTVFNSGHFGAIGHYAMQAAQQNMVGVCFTGAGLSVVPTFASKPMLGTNPIALAAPARNEAPMLFDAATSAIAGNKIRLAMRVGSPLLPGWVTDKEGIPIMEEKPVFDRDDFFQAPLGSTREQGSHKGYGFALMAEVLATALSGALPTMLAPGVDPRTSSPRTTSRPSPTWKSSRTPWTRCSRRSARPRPPRDRSVSSIRACRRPKSWSTAAPRGFPCTRKCSSGSESARAR